MEAHLERVAKLAEQLKLTPICEYETFLAAALAACARESRLDEARFWAAEDYHMVDGPEECIYCARLTEAERAVGEKAALDPQRGQHES